MRPWNPHAFTFAGKPIVGAAPVGLVVFGPPLTGRQRAMAQSAYVSFLAMTRVSVAPNQQQYGLLPDGSPFHISVVGPATKMMIWTSASSSKINKYLSGFVFTELDDGGAVYDGRRHIVDVVTATGGTHTAKWKTDTLTKEEFAPLRRSSEINALRNAVRGPSGLPYSLSGATFGRVLFDMGLVNTGRFEELLGFNGNKVYTLSEAAGTGGDGARALISTTSTLSGPVGINNSLPTVTGMVETPVLDPMRAGGYYDWSFNGDSIVVQARNRKIAPPYVIVPEEETLFLENTGPLYSNGPINSILVTIPGTEIEGPVRFQMYERSGDVFQLDRDMILPDNEIVPPLAAYVFRDYGQPEPYTVTRFSGRVLNTDYVGEDMYEPIYTRFNFDWGEIGNGYGIWRADCIGVDKHGGDGRSIYSHTKVYRPDPPEFGFASTLFDCVVTDKYDYRLDFTSTLNYRTEGYQFGPEVPSSMKDAYLPPATGNPTWAPWWDGGTYKDGGQTSREVSTGLTTCTLETGGAPFLLRRSRVVVETETSVNEFMEALGRGGPNSYSHSVGAASIESYFLARAILMYDPYLDILCYTEYESEINYALTSAYDALQPNTGSGTGTYTWTRSAGPATADIKLPVCRLVIERRGAPLLELPLDKTELSLQLRDLHATISGFGFDTPAASGNAQRAQVLPPDVVVAGLGVGVVAPYTGVTPYFPSAVAGVFVRYMKSMSTGAMILEVYRPGEPPLQYAIDKLQFRTLAALRAELGTIDDAEFQLQAL